MLNYCYSFPTQMGGGHVQVLSYQMFCVVWYSSVRVRVCVCVCVCVCCACGCVCMHACMRVCVYDIIATRYSVSQGLPYPLFGLVN